MFSKERQIEIRSIIYDPRQWPRHTREDLSLMHEQSEDWLLTMLMGLGNPYDALLLTGRLEIQSVSMSVNNHKTHRWLAIADNTLYSSQARKVFSHV